MREKSYMVNQIPESGISEFFDVKGLGEGVLSLGVGEPDFDTADHIRDAAVEALRASNTKYTDNRGIDVLRDEVAKYLAQYGPQYDPDTEILVTCGASEGIDLALRALLNPGDEVLIIQPSYVSYLPCVALCGGVPVVVPTKAEHDFKVKREDLEACVSEKTKLLILPYPGNPTGAVMREDELREVADFVIEHDLYVLSDEIYGELTYEGRHVSISVLPGMRERTVLINGFSKAFAMTGWRIGMAAAPAEIMSLMKKIHQYTIMSVGTVNQVAAIEALTSPLRQGEIDHMKAVYKERRDILVAGMQEIGYPVSEPGGAFYAFVDITSSGLSSEAYCRRLLEEAKVALVPGTAFGECGEGFVRCTYAYDTEKLKECIRRMKQFQESLVG